MRIFTVFILIAAGTIMGLIYSIIHDEITYSLSPEFYLKVRFGQMNIETGSPRIGVAKVGLLNTWFYSLTISTVLAMAGLFHKDVNNVYKYTFQSFFISVSIA